MRRVLGIGSLLAVSLVGVASCGTHAAGHSVPTGSQSAARAARSSTGWIPPATALPRDAGPAAARNLVYLDALGTFGYMTPLGEQQSLVVYRVTSLSGPATRIAIIAPPSCCNFTFVTAADDDRTFLAAASPGRNTKFYELRLSHDGKPQPLTPLRLRVPGSILPNGIALTPDGSELAAITARGRNGPYRIVVIATSTGTMRAWTWRGPRPQFPSWSGDQAIDFISTPQDAGSTMVRLHTSAAGRRSAFRVLVTRFGQPGSLARWSPWVANGLTVTAGGRTAFVPLGDGGSAGHGPRIALLRVSASTGRPQQVLARPWTVPAGNSDFSCGVIWTDASGRHFLISCGLRSGRVDDGSFTPITLQPTPYVPSPDSIFAW